MTGRAFPVWFLVVFASLSVPAISAAQSSVSALRFEHFAEVEPGQRLRIVTGPGAIVGPFERFAADTLWLQSPQGAASAPYPAGTIRNVWAEEKNTVKGAFIGGVLGALGTAAFVALAWNQEDDESEDHDAAIPIIVGGGLGALIGGVIGNKMPRWQVRYP